MRAKTMWSLGFTLPTANMMRYCSNGVAVRRLDFRRKSPFSRRASIPTGEATPSLPTTGDAKSRWVLGKDRGRTCGGSRLTRCLFATPRDRASSNRTRSCPAWRFNSRLFGPKGRLDL